MAQGAPCWRDFGFTSLQKCRESLAIGLGALATVTLSAHSGENPPRRKPCHGVNDACVVLLLTNHRGSAQLPQHQRR